MTKHGSFLTKLLVTSFESLLIKWKTIDSTNPFDADKVPIDVRFVEKTNTLFSCRSINHCHETEAGTRRLLTTCEDLRCHYTTAFCKNRLQLSSAQQSVPRSFKIVHNKSYLAGEANSSLKYYPTPSLFLRKRKTPS